MSKKLFGDSARDQQKFRGNTSHEICCRERSMLDFMMVIALAWMNPTAKAGSHGIGTLRTRGLEAGAQPSLPHCHTASTDNRQPASIEERRSIFVPPLAHDTAARTPRWRASPARA